ncbi:MAG: ParB N-terminal domain-containing protein, partial [Proteobacteria bacterium]|nr:ParB N-terminal domain-containing protein [Pseudomonadota bacterium]
MYRRVLEPVLVTPKDGKYLLLCGERRYLAAQKLELASIPALIVNTITQKDEILVYQLTENLQREALNPIDQAKGVLSFIQARHPDKGYGLDGVMSDLVNFERSPDYLSKEVSETFSEIVEIAGKTIKTLFNGLSLLKLSDEIQAAVRTGNLPLKNHFRIQRLHFRIYIVASSSLSMSEMNIWPGAWVIQMSG